MCFNVRGCVLCVCVAYMVCGWFVSVCVYVFCVSCVCVNMCVLCVCMRACVFDEGVWLVVCVRECVCGCVMCV